MSNSLNSQKFIAPFLKRKVNPEHIDELHNFFQSKNFLLFLEQQFSYLNNLSYNKKTIKKLIKAIEFSTLGLAIHSRLEDKIQPTNKLNILIGDLLIIKGLGIIDEVEESDIKGFFYSKGKGIFNSQLHLNLNINKNNLSIRNYFNNKSLSYWVTLPWEMYLAKIKPKKLLVTILNKLSLKITHYTLIKKNQILNKQKSNPQEYSFLKIYLREKHNDIYKKILFNSKTIVPNPILNLVKDILNQEKKKVLQQIKFINIKIKKEDSTLFPLLTKAQENYLMDLENLNVIY